MSDGETDRGLLDTLLAVLPEFGVHPFEARKECTGFIFNRVWAAIKRESLAVVAEGVARPEDVDGMFKINWRVPAGPFQLMDQVGLDVVLDIENHYARRVPAPAEERARDSCSPTSMRASSASRPARASTRIRRPESHIAVEYPECGTPEMPTMSAFHVRGKNRGPSSRGRSVRPARRWSKKRLRHLETTCRGVSRRAAISSLPQTFGGVQHDPGSHDVGIR